MDPYNFWQDFFDTYQSLPDWLKALWLIVPPAFVLGLLALLTRLKLGGKQADVGIDGELVYSIRRDDRDQFHIVSHSQQLDSQPALLLLDAPDRDPDQLQHPARRT